MTDYFALLEQPRLPWLERAEVETSFHRLARQFHPDSGSGNPNKFAELNQAFATLRDHHLRLRHLLLLENYSDPSNVSVTFDDTNLFSRAAAIANDARELVQARYADSAIARSVTQTTRIQAVRQLNNVLQQLQREYDANITRLIKLNENWTGQKKDDALADAAELQRRFTFLEKWQTILRELLFQLEHNMFI